MVTRMFRKNVGIAMVVVARRAETGDVGFCFFFLFFFKALS